MKTIRILAASLATAAVLAGTACSSTPTAPDPDPGIDSARATGECQVLAGLLTTDQELSPDNVEDMVEILAGISENGYPESVKVADMIIASYSQEPPSQQEADAIVDEWAGFCTRNSLA